MNSLVAFVAGSPRSGTTALTRMLIEHPDVFHAGPDELGTRANDRPTFESGIFVRLADDAEIARRFAAIDGRKPVILEKTPSHVEHIERMRRTCPGARFVLTLRSGVEVMKSLKVARTTFLKDGQDFRGSCGIWDRATRAVLNQQGKPDVLIVRYPDLMARREAVAAEVFDFLGLDRAHLAHCLREMDNPDKERVKGVVGATVRGGADAAVNRLTLREKMIFSRLCGKTQRRAGFQSVFLQG